MNPRVIEALVAFPLMLAASLAPGGCATGGAVGAASRPDLSVADRFTAPSSRVAECDFGLLRVTRHMWCEDEFARRRDR